MRRSALLLCAVLWLGFSPGASAKGLTSVRACGREDCVVIGDLTLAAQIVTVAEVVEAPARGAYYRLDIAQDVGRETQTFSDLFVPSSGLLGANLGSARRLLWYQPAGRATPELRAALDALAPFPVPPAWPVAVDTPAEVSTPDSRDLMAWVLTAGLVALMLGGMALVSRRVRTRRLRTV